MGTYFATWGAIALQGPHHVANASMMTTGLAAMVSRNCSSLEGGYVLAGREQAPAAPKVDVGSEGRELCATHEAMLWTVILGELVVNCLVAVGRVVDGVPRRVLKAGRSSLDVIGNKWGA